MEDKFENIKQSINNLKNKNFDKNDPLGSYTGVSENPYDEPQQDADDL